MSFWLLINRILLIIRSLTFILLDTQLLVESPIEPIQLVQPKVMNISQCLLGPYWNTF